MTSPSDDAAGVSQWRQARLALLQQAASREPDKPEWTASLADAFLESANYREAAQQLCALFAHQRYEPSLNLLRAARDSAAEWTELRRRLAAIIAFGAHTPWILDRYVTAVASLNDRAEVARLLDFDRLLYDCCPLLGLADAATFNRDLAAEIRTNLHHYDERPGWAIHGASRHNDFFDCDLPAARRLAAIVHRQITTYVAALPEDGSHPHLAAKPTAFDVVAWGLVSGQESYHSIHIHPRAWITGIYYVVAPEGFEDPARRTGWLRIGLSRDGDGDGEWPTRWIAPTPGRLIIMPGYFPHETRPMEVDSERICVVFDVIPR